MWNLSKQGGFMKKIYCLAIFMMATNCGDADNSMSLEGPHIALSVKQSKSHNPNISHGQIDHYTLTVTAADLKIPFTHVFGGDAEAGKITDIPTGSKRTLTMEAININQQVIRRGRVEGIDIVPGMFSTVEIVMHAVPIFVNIKDKSAVADRRLQFTLFGETGSELSLMEEASPTEAKNLVDQNTGKAVIDTASRDGLFLFTPEVMDHGLHHFKVLDVKNGEESTLVVSLYEQTVRPGLSLNSGGTARKIKNQSQLSTLGAFYYREKGDDHLGNETLLDVVDVAF